MLTTLKLVGNLQINKSPKAWDLRVFLIFWFVLDQAKMNKTE